jgi:hypothetical protein
VSDACYMSSIIMINADRVHFFRAQYAAVRATLYQVSTTPANSHTRASFCKLHFPLRSTILDSGNRAPCFEQLLLSALPDRVPFVLRRLL